MNTDNRRRIGAFLALGFLGSGVAWATGACSGNRGLPRDLVPAEVTRAPVRGGGPAELVWGGWHPVPWDTRAALVLDRAYRLQLQGNREDAIAVLNTGLSGMPDCASLLEARAALYAAMGYRRAAERDFEEVAGLEPLRARTWGALARMRQELGLASAALVALDQAAELGLDDADLHLTWARALREQGDTSHAAGRYAMALERTPHPTFELLVEAATLYFQGDEPTPASLERALAIQADSVRTDPDEEIQVRLVETLLRELRGKENETIAAGLRALEIRGETLRNWTDLALLAIRLDDPLTRDEVDPMPMALGPPGPR